MIVIAMLGVCVAALAQTGPLQPWSLWGQVWASAFGQWSIASLTMVPSPGTYKLELSTAAPPVLPGGQSFQPLATNAPLIVDPGANQERVTPSAVNCSFSQGFCSITVTLTKAHNYNFAVKSGTDGLQEALNYQKANGGSVVIDPFWGGTTSIITSASGSANVEIVDERTGQTTWYGWNGTGYQSSFSINNPAPDFGDLTAASITTAGTLSATGGGTLSGTFGGAPTLTAPIITSLTTTGPEINAGGSHDIEGVLYADQFPGADIGAKINAAIAALPSGCGTVVVPAGTYAYSTTVYKPRCVNIAGQGIGQTGPGYVLGGTTLEWTPSSGVAMVAGDSGGEITYPAGTVRDLTIITTAANSTAIGLWLGGDVNGTILPPTATANGQSFVNLSIANFGTGVEFGNNAYVTVFDRVSIGGGTVGIAMEAGSTNNNENNRFINGGIGGLGGPALASGASQLDLHFSGESFDFNNQNGADTSATFLSSASFLNCHFEQSYRPFISAPDAAVFESTFEEDCGPSPAPFPCPDGYTGDPYMVQATTTATITNSSFFANHAVTAAIDGTGQNGSSPNFLTNDSFFSLVGALYANMPGATTLASYASQSSSQPSLSVPGQFSAFNPILGAVGSIASTYVGPSSFESFSPGGSLTGGAEATITPPVNVVIGWFGVGANAYISGGTGTPESVVITATGTSCPNGTSTSFCFTPTNSHSGSWSITGENNYTVTANGGVGFTDYLGRSLADFTAAGAALPEPVTVPYSTSGINGLLVGSASNMGGDYAALAIAEPSGTTFWPFIIKQGSAAIAHIDAAGNAAFAGGVTAASVTNSCSGVSGAMAAGTVTVTNACITGSRPIMLVEATKGGTQGFLSYTQSSGSLVISSTSSTDTSTVSWVQN